MKTKYNFAVNDRVALALSEDEDTGEYTKLRYQEYDEPPTGKIVSIDKSRKAVVEWDDAWRNTTPPKMEELKNLLPEADFKKEWSRLAKEFSTLEKEVTVKVKEAAKLLREANKIAKKQGRELANMYDAVAPLLDAMDDTGWRTSSFNC